MTEDAKIRFLFKKIQYSRLYRAIKAMKAYIMNNITGSLSYNTVDNYISTVVSELPDYQSRNRNIGSIHGGQNNDGENGIYNNAKSINSDHHDDYSKVLADD